jgi:hypothetical protein
VRRKKKARGAIPGLKMNLKQILPQRARRIAEKETDFTPELFYNTLSPPAKTLTHIENLDTYLSLLVSPDIDIGGRRACSLIFYDVS